MKIRSSCARISGERGSGRKSFHESKWQWVIGSCTQACFIRSMRVSRKLRIAYFAHSLRSDWNNGNAHFLRGLMRALGAIGHEIVVFEPHKGWSFANLMSEPCGKE